MEWNLFCSVSSIGQIIWVDARSSIQGTAIFWQYLYSDFYQDLGREKMASPCCRVPFTRWECTLFFGPAILQYKSLLWLLHIQGIFPTFSPTFFFMASLLAKVEWGGEPLDHLESHQGTGQQGVLVLKKTGAGIWGEGPYQDRWWFIMWSHIYLPWVSSNARQASRIQSHLKTIPL